MIIRITRYALLITILLGGASFASTATKFQATGNPTDTASGLYVVISGEALRYSINNVTMPTAEVIATDSHQVTSEYGFSGLNPLSDIAVTPGDVAIHSYKTTVEGNCTMPATIEVLYNQYSGAANWRVELWVGTPSTLYTTLDAGVVFGGSASWQDNEDSNIALRIYVPSSTVEAPSGSYVTVTYTLEVTASPTGEYTGGNYFTYGGVGFRDNSVNDIVVTPNIIFSRTATVDAPLAFTGGSHEVVPGSIITYTVTFNNIGNGTADSLAIIGKIPANTNLAHVNKTGATDNVYITAPASILYGGNWNAWYSTLDNPIMVYGMPTGWVSIGTVSSLDAYPAGSGTYKGYPAEDAPYTAKWIKFEKSSLQPIAVDRTLTWGVTVR